MFKQNKKPEIIDFSESKSNSPYSEEFVKERLIRDYSRSTFNIENELFMNDNSTQEKFKVKSKKTNKKYDSNLYCHKKKKKKIIINNDNELNIYYNLENKKKDDINNFSNISNNNLNTNNNNN